jgi:hypothetical protein
VAGFNQFFDDFNATSAWVYGGAVDQKFSQSIYGGAALYYRDMEVPWFLQSAGGAILNEADWEEYQGRAYLYWTPHNWFSLSAEYLYEKVERDQDYTEGIVDLKSHRFPLGVNFFHPTGISIGLKTTYYNQKGEFETLPDPLNPSQFVSGKDDFWVVDAAISYRLPKRYGFITVGVKNLFDEEFLYADTDLNNPSVLPDRFIFSKVTLAIP